MDPYVKITKNFTKKLRSKVLNRQYFHRKTGLKSWDCSCLILYHTRIIFTWFGFFNPPFLKSLNYHKMTEINIYCNRKFFIMPTPGLYLKNFGFEACTKICRCLRLFSYWSFLFVFGLPNNHIQIIFIKENLFCKRLKNESSEENV